MKKIKTLACALAVTVIATGAAFAAETAKPSVHHVYLDGVAVQPTGYEILDNNYFKLRDVAKLLTGGGKQFNVTWDEGKNAINLVSSQAYTAVGGELAAGDGAVKTAKPSTAAVYKDAATLPLTGYEVADNNYYKLRDVAAAFGIEVKWDEAAQRIDLLTSTVTTPEEKPAEPEKPAEETVPVTLNCIAYVPGTAFQEGDPILAGLKVELYQCDWDYGDRNKRIKVGEGTTDANGKITFSFDAPKSVYEKAFQITQYLAIFPEQTINGKTYYGGVTLDIFDIETLKNGVFKIAP